MTFIVMSAPYVVPYPPRGTLISTYCSGTTKMGHYHDGNGGTYDAVIQTNSTECGYVPPPAYGTLLSTYCSGTTKMGRYADGNGGTYDAVIETNSTACGYDPNLQGGGGQLRINTAWNGGADVDVHVVAPDGYQYGYSYSGGGNGAWDHDSTSAGQENVAWSPTCPNGNYWMELINWRGDDPGTITVTIILNGVTRTVDMTGTLPLAARATSTVRIYFSVSNGVFSVNPYRA